MRKRIILGQATLGQVFDKRKLDKPQFWGLLHSEVEQALADQARNDMGLVIDVIKRQGAIGVESI